MQNEYMYVIRNTYIERFSGDKIVITLFYIQHYKLNYYFYLSRFFFFFFVHRSVKWNNVKAIIISITIEFLSFRIYVIDCKQHTIGLTGRNYYSFVVITAYNSRVLIVENSLFKCVRGPTKLAERWKVFTFRVTVDTAYTAQQESFSRNINVHSTINHLCVSLIVVWLHFSDVEFGDNTGGSDRRRLIRMSHCHASHD